MSLYNLLTSLEIGGGKVWEEALVGEEHLSRLDEGGYAFDDPFFRRWVQLNALPDIGLQPPPLAPSE